MKSISFNANCFFRAQFMTTKAADAMGSIDLGFLIDDLNDLSGTIFGTDTTADTFTFKDFRIRPEFIQQKIDNKGWHSIFHKIYMGRTW